jgi:hypothetical protein
MASGMMVLRFLASSLVMTLGVGVVLQAARTVAVKSTMGKADRFMGSSS